MTRRLAVMFGEVEDDPDGGRTVYVDRAYEVRPSPVFVRVRRWVHIAWAGWSA